MRNQSICRKVTINIGWAVVVLIIAIIIIKCGSMLVEVPTGYLNELLALSKFTSIQNNNNTY